MGGGEDEGMTKLVVEVGAVGTAVEMVVMTLGAVVVGFAGGGADVTEESTVATKRKRRADLCIHVRGWDLVVEGAL